MYLCNIILYECVQCLWLYFTSMDSNYKIVADQAGRKKQSSLAPESSNNTYIYIYIYTYTTI